LIFERIATGSGPQWTERAFAGNPGADLYDVSCPYATYCIVVGRGGTTAISTDAGTTWQLQPATTTKDLGSIGCLAGSQLCYATTGDGFVLSSFGLSGWSEEAQQEHFLDGMSCAYSGSDYRCVAVGDPGVIISLLHVPPSGGGNGGGGNGGGHCGTPANPCPH
jgi:hypothetical protein